MRKILAICLLVAVLLAGCTDNTPQARDTLVVGTSQMEGKFSPFFYTNAYDNDIISLVHVNLLTQDRQGSMVLSGIQGEVRPYLGTDYRYQGIADCEITDTPDGFQRYLFRLRQDVRFSDGVLMDIDDVIFSMYVAVDPTYDGIMTLYSLPILGMEEYRSGSAEYVTGIEKIDQFTMEVVLSEPSASAIYTLSVPVAPLHYYGDESQYDFENHRFGFPKGDLSRVRQVTTKPLGAGPYVFESFQNGVVSLHSNPNYYKGQPKIENLQFRQGQDADKLSGVVSGTLDVADPSYSLETAAAIEKTNGGMLSGEKITTMLTDNLGYGYIGIHAKNVSVGGEPGSEASRNLRKALATVIAAYRDVAVNSYYGSAAKVIEYPISNTSWAAPRATDAGYVRAFSLRVDGTPIYTGDMTQEQRYDAAKKAALEYFVAAGYTQENGVLTAAPQGAAMEYEVLVSGGGTGDHPVFMCLSMASKALQEIGMSLYVTDLSNFSDLSATVQGGAAQLYAMAWGASADPDMYQVYHSQGASSEKNYYIKDDQLDSLILQARQSSDQAFRKEIYRECLDIIAQWAVEVPVYQRQNAVIFATDRVNVDTLTRDMTPFWGWEQDIENLELR